MPGNWDPDFYRARAKQWRDPVVSIAVGESAYGLQISEVGSSNSNRPARQHCSRHGFPARNGCSTGFSFFAAGPDAADLAAAYAVCLTKANALVGGNKRGRYSTRPDPERLCPEDC
jgi:hypothetical protein